MRALADRLNLGSPQTLYNWRQGHNRPSRAAVEALARFMGESPADLTIEMASPVGIGQEELIAALTARRLNAQWHRTHLQDVRSLLGLHEATGQTPEPEGVDLVVPLLRQRLPDCMVSLLLSRRGRMLRVPYEYVIHVESDPTDSAEPPADPEQLRGRVQQALAGLRGPAWWERSSELLPSGWDRAGVTLIYPRLMESRPPDWLNLRYEPSEGVADIFVLSVYHGGAPDVGALLAPCLGFGFSTITSLAAQLGSWTMNPLRTGREIAAQTDLARAITTPHSPIAGPFVWSINDPEPILDATVRQNMINHFTGRVVFLELTSEALDYAAWQVAAVEALPEPPPAARVREYRDVLSHHQAGLAAIAAELDYIHRSSNRILRLPIELSAEVSSGTDGSYSDAEDAFFDQWAEAALKVRMWLDQFARDGQVAPSPERVRLLVRAEDLLGPLVHSQRQQPVSSSQGST
jgi:transcriptional regulator with XRE-family HTH domain